MRKLLFAFALLCSVGAQGQGIIFTAPLPHTNGAPTGNPSAQGSRMRYDTTTNELFTNVPGTGWMPYKQGIDRISGTIAPAYTPNKGQSDWAVNGANPPELYYWTGSVWLRANPVGSNLTAGDGIAITGTPPDITISNTGILDVVAGADISVDVSSGTATVTNAAPDQTVSLSGTGITVGGTYPSFTLTAADQSATNEIQALSILGSTLSLSNGGGSVTVDPSSTNEAQTLSVSGSPNPTVSLSTAGGAGGGSVQIQGGGNTTVTQSANVVTVTSTGGAPAGSTGQVQFNNAGAFAGASQITYNNSNGRMAAGGTTQSGRLTVNDNGHTGDYVFEVRADDQIPWVAGFFNSTYSTSVPVCEYFAFNSGEFRMGTPAAKNFVLYTNGYANPRVVITGAGNVGFNINSPSSIADVNGTNGYSQLRLRTTYTPTSTADALGNTGDTAWDASYFYVKTATGWKRAALSTF